MTIDILMPALSPTMEEGTLSKWLVKEGDTVESGDLIAEIETDKATMEFEAVDDGVIEKLLIAEGKSGVKVNTPIARMSGDNEVEESAKPSDGDAAAPLAPPPKEEAKAEAPAPQAPVKNQAAANNKGARVFATPLARRLAKNNNLDLSQIEGSGPRNRIIKADIEKHLASGASTAQKTAPISSAEAAISPQSEAQKIPLDGMRKTIAARLTESKQNIPHFYLRRSVEIDKLLALRKELNQGLEKDGIKISVNDFIIKAVARALAQYPSCNRIWAGDHMLAFGQIDVAVAVAVEGGLFTPVLRNLKEARISRISQDIKALASRAREKKLTPEEYTGGATAISNLGMYGIENFDAVINPPHASILAVGAGRAMPVAREDGTLSVATCMSLTLSCDHRVIDGALGAQFLASIVEGLESPSLMLA